jgi:hypothetical protein
VEDNYSRPSEREIRALFSTFRTVLARIRREAAGKPDIIEALRASDPGRVEHARRRALKLIARLKQRARDCDQVS